MNIEKIYSLLFDETPVKSSAATESRQPSAYQGETSANFDREIKNIRRNFGGEISVTQGSRRDSAVKSVPSRKAFESSYGREYSPEETQTVDVTDRPFAESIPKKTKTTYSTESHQKANNPPRKYPHINPFKTESEDTQTIDVTESIQEDNKLLKYPYVNILKPVKEAVTEDTEDETEEKDFDTITFDEEAFAESIEIEPESITGIFIAATEEEDEHLEISYEKQDEIVAIKVFEDGSVEQTVNANILDAPEFEAYFEETVDEDGEIVEGDATLVLTPILEDEEEDEEDEEDLDLPKTEEDVIADSEEDNDTEDEDGNIDSEEYVDPSGLDLDEYYSTTHKMKAVQNPGNRLIGNTRSHTISQESRRPKTIRKPSEEMKISLSTKKGKGSSTEKVRPATVRK